MIDPFGWLGIIFAQAVVWPQLYKTWRSKDVKSISLFTYIFLVIAVLLYFLHALVIGDLVFMLTNGLSFLTNGFLLYLILKYRK